MQVVGKWALTKQPFLQVVSPSLYKCPDQQLAFIRHRKCKQIRIQIWNQNKILAVLDQLLHFGFTHQVLITYKQLVPIRHHKLCTT